MGKDTFRDFIPEGEEVGAQGSGYKDFVPPVVVVVPKKEEKKDTTRIEETKDHPAGEQMFKCDKCDFTTLHKLALAGHKRKHKE